MSKRVLVSGGAGFIGSFLVDKLVEKGHQVTIYDSLVGQPNQKKPDYVNENATFVQDDVLHYKNFKEQILQADVIFHFAALVGIAQSNYKIKEFVQNNLMGTAHLLNILTNCDHNVQKVLLPGSNTSYGEGLYSCSDCGTFHPEIRTESDIKKQGWDPVCPSCKNPGIPIPTPEDMPLTCNSIYAQTKRNQEDMLRLIGEMYGIPFTILRFFNIFGPRQSLDNPYTGVSAIFMSRIKSDNVPLVYEDGKQTRDFVSVHDAVRMFEMSMKSKAANNQVFNVGSGIPTTIADVASTIAEFCGKDIRPKISETFRKGDIRHCIADISKIKNALDFSPSINFEQGIQELVTWSETQKSVDRFDQAAQELKDKKLI